MQIVQKWIYLKLWHSIQCWFLAPYLGFYFATKLAGKPLLVVSAYYLRSNLVWLFLECSGSSAPFNLVSSKGISSISVPSFLQDFKFHPAATTLGVSKADTNQSLCLSLKHNQEWHYSYCCMEKTQTSSHHAGTQSSFMPMCSGFNRSCHRMNMPM